MGGIIKNPSYKEVSLGKTGHIEVCQIIYNCKKISYDELLKKFWEIHNHTQLNRQGLDIGTQYKSVIFYHSKKQKAKAIESKKKEEQKIGNFLTKSPKRGRFKEQKKYNKKIVTEIKSAKAFYKAEECHQDYYKKCRV